MREEAIRRIVAILKDEECNLSDGYAYYCSWTEAEDIEALDSIEDKTLRRIAERIIDDLPLSYLFQENRVAEKIVEAKRREDDEGKNDG